MTSHNRSIFPRDTLGDLLIWDEPDRCGNTWRALTQPSASTEQEGYTMVANHTPPTPRNGVKRGQG